MSPEGWTWRTVQLLRQDEDHFRVVFERYRSDEMGLFTSDTVIRYASMDTLRFVLDSLDALAQGREIET